MGRVSNANAIRRSRVLAECYVLACTSPDAACDHWQTAMPRVYRNKEGEYSWAIRDFLRIHSDWLRDGRDPWGNYGKIVPPIYEGHEQTRGGDTSTRAPSASSDAASGATSPRKQPLNTEVAA